VIEVCAKVISRGHLTTSLHAYAILSYMKDRQGSVAFSVIIVALCALVIVGIGYYYFLRATNDFVATPASGAAPLSVVLTYTVASKYTNSVYIDYGDGTRSGTCMDFCPNTLATPHTYVSSGIYHAKLLRIVGDRDAVIGSVTINVADQQ